eukprot:Sro2341_g324090.1 n/a (127) ;mRNA; f:11034-11414
MGNVPSFSFENRDDMRRKLEEEMEKAKGTYWNRHESVWDKQLEEFEGYFAVYKGVRKEKDIAHYVDLRCLLEHSEGEEAVLENLKREASMMPQTLTPRVLARVRQTTKSFPDGETTLVQKITARST